MDHKEIASMIHSTYMYIYEDRATGGGLFYTHQAVKSIVKNLCVCLSWKKLTFSSKLVPGKNLLADR